MSPINLLILIFKNNNMRYIRSSIILLTGVSCLLLFHSCSTCSRQQTVENITIDLDMADIGDISVYLNMSNQVLFALPTPIEASMLVKNWGIPDPALLNDPANASGYLTKKKQALNFGVYLTDMTTAGLYEQTQTVLRYKQAMQQLGEALGLQSAVDQKTLQQIEENINDKEKLLQIISDLYASCTSYLSENDRDFYALAVLSGGWVEGMFLATNMIDENNNDAASQMEKVIMENKLTFDLLWQALGEMDDIPDEAVSLMIDMSYVAHLFGHQTLLSVPRNTESIYNITPKYFADVKEHIRILRRQFTQK